ncbi:MAG: SDR family oxidoreductase [Actinobacteria bacterium]|nr:SDR family oxidoreductase [Actinomycetota bacterium]
MDPTRHRGRTALVTGAGSGIGRATAIRLAREGADVVGCDIDEAGLEGTRRALEDAGQAADLHLADITDQAAIDRLVEQAGPRVDVLANVAGIMDHFIPLGDLDDATWDHVMDVNLTGAMRLSRAVLPVMQANHGGAIVTVASEASLHPGAAGTAYATSKHALVGLVRSVAFYYGPDGIRSNAVLPGNVETNIGTTSTPAVPWAMERAKIALAPMPPRAAQPDEIAAAISWRACDEASDVNGALLTADGGWCAA